MTSTPNSLGGAGLSTRGLTPKRFSTSESPQQEAPRLPTSASTDTFETGRVYGKTSENDATTSAATSAPSASSSRHNSILSQNDLPPGRVRRESLLGNSMTACTTMTGILLKKKGNAPLYKLTSVIKDMRTPNVWKEREFSISDDGLFSYSKGNKKHASINLKDALVKLSSPFQDQYGGYHIHLHTFDGAPTPFMFEIGARSGLDGMWALCARTEKEMTEWLSCIVYHMYHTVEVDSLADSQLPGRSVSPPIMIDEGYSRPASSLQVLNRGESTYSDNSNNAIGGAPSILERVSGGRLLYKSPSSVALGGQPTSILTLTFWIRLLEVLVGFSLLNLLLVLLIYSAPSSIEAYLFGGSINLLVCFAILVRLEQVSHEMLTRSTSSGDHLRQSQPHPIEGTQRIFDAGDSDAEEGVEEVPTEVGLAEAAVLTLRTSGARAKEPTARRNVLCSNLKSVATNDSEATSDSAARSVPPHSYSALDATTMDVRIGPNYRKEGRKAPSEPALMDLLGCDLYYAEEKIDHVAEKMIFPEPSSVWSSGIDGGDMATTKYKALPGGLPHFFVFNIQIQKPGTTGMLGARTEGYSLICYFQPSEDFIHQAQAATSSSGAGPDICSNAARLTLKWLTSFQTDSSLRERLKLKATVLNLDTCDISGWVLRYNGKPTMITKSNNMTKVLARTQSGRLCEVVECDVDLRMWNLLFRQGLNVVFPGLRKISFALALVIEGETDDELPERVLAGVRLNHIDTKIVNHW